MSRRRKGDVDWIVGHWAEGALSISATTAQNVPLIQGTDLDEHDDAVTVLRVVGQVMAYWIGDESPPAPVAFIHERIRVGTENFETSTISTAGRPSFTSVADEAFLWHRVRHTAQLSTQFQESEHPFWSVVNVKVKRALRPGMSLIYTVENTSGALPLAIWPFLRVLVRF